jgi:hypothetical protein
MNTAKLSLMFFAVGDCCSYEGKLKRIAPGQEDVRRALAVMLSE